MNLAFIQDKFVSIISILTKMKEVKMKSKFILSIKNAINFRNKVYRNGFIKLLGIKIFVLLCGLSTVNAQGLQRNPPIWWWGGSLAVNMNFYSGTTQFLNPAVISSMPFHKGTGIAPYVSLLGEYRRNKLWGIMLNLSFDDRGGAFKHLTSPTGKNVELGHTLSYLSIEPSFKIMPFKQGFYLFLGPEVNFNIMKK